ncbi:hydroxymyristoyl-ACP dehydratase [Erwinia sp. B116]|uniref:ApeI family dehydratase n=1 Tax=Erwinia sp. B116 TaxID=1561024 RepID=UPI000C794F42|nr:hydroxymyristoyl-ACP dehydratase [Erwinia sp. B116]PLV62108.1 hydroxymyristoyl-ACP dehydratase [Erwinia sp. B116]
MLPVELGVTRQTDRLELLLRVDAELFWFQGHFPAQPLLPGVAQLDWAIHYATQLLVPGKAFVAVESIKFQHPVLPGASLALTLSWQAPQKLTFLYEIIQPQGRTPASSGKVTLC